MPTKAIHTIIILLISTISHASPGIISKKKDEMSGETTYSYFQMASNDSDENLTITCNPSGGLDLQFCYTNYYHQLRCHTDFEYKFDDGEIEKEIWTNRSLKESYAYNKKFIQRIAEHDKIIIRAFKGADTPIFKIKNARHKFKQFAHQCPLQINSRKKNTKNINNSHTHGKRTHNHPFPKSGKTHRHGNGDLGR